MKNVAEYHIGQVSTNGRQSIQIPQGAYVSGAYVRNGSVYISVLQDTDQPYVLRTFLCVSPGMNVAAFGNTKRHWFIDRIEYSVRSDGTPINYYIVEEEQ